MTLGNLHLNKRIRTRTAFPFSKQKRRIGMAKKRGNQEGSIYRKANGKWRAQLMLTGGRLSVTVSSRSEAQDWLRSTRNQIANGLTYRGATTTFSDFLDDWLLAAKARLTEHTCRDYNLHVRDYIKPALGNLRLRDLNPSVIQKFYDKQSADGFGARTIQKSHAVIRASLNSAMKLGLLSRNAANATQPPRVVRKEMMFLNDAQVKQLLKIAKQLGDRNFALYYLALSTGMRQGELLALRWDDINLDQGWLNVKFSLKRLTGGGLQLANPKTSSSLRSVKLGKDAVEILRQQMIRNSKDKSQAGNLWQDMNFVFPSTVGTPMDPTNALKAFQKLLQQAGLPRMRFHDLRHTAASLMLNNGVDVLVASQRLGHAKPSITLDVYGHLIHARQAHAAEVLDGLLSKG